MLKSMGGTAWALAAVVVGAFVGEARAQVELNPGDRVTGISGRADEDTLYVLQVAPGANAVITLSGGSGDCDLYAGYSEDISEDDAPFKSEGSRTKEKITIADPISGELFILIRGRNRFRNVTMTVASQLQVVDQTLAATRTSAESRLRVNAGTERQLRLTINGGAAGARDTRGIRITVTGTEGDAELALKGTYPASADDAAAVSDGNELPSVVEVTDLAESGISTTARYAFLAVRSNTGLTGGKIKIERLASSGGDGEARKLTSGSTTRINGDEGDELKFYVSVPSNATLLRVRTSGGTGNADLYVQRGEIPDTDSDEPLSSVNDGNSETIEVDEPESGRWYIVVKGVEDFSNVRLVATVETEDED
ncbi:MAG: PPC domain-containing protein [Planctomycetota bacterium]|nr:PPC domain-containing protein [Planctomycetota bacterium]